MIQYSYDNRNRLITRTDAMNQSESWSYDGLGHTITHTDRKGQVTDISYDALSRRSLVSYADGSGTQANYDAGNRLTSLTDSNSGTLSWGYDGLDDVTSTGTPQGSIGYTYDAASRRVSMTPASQATANYTYDNANRLTTITQGSETVQMGYDIDNRRTVLTLPNGVMVNYGYDIASELTGLTYTQGNGTTLGNLTYGYDGKGLLNSKGGTFATDVAPTATTQPGMFDLNDRETGFNGQALSYDANGNLTNDGTNTYTWNARNQLTQISQNGSVQMSYSYDAMGRRISKAAQGGTPTQYLYDNLNAVQETIGTAVNPILNGPGVDERYARNDVTGRMYFLTDALGSTIALTDPTGAVREQYSYDPYGNTTLSDTTTGFTNSYQFMGREADSPGLYYYRARYYSPQLPGFISEDPIGFAGGQLSFYAAFASDPIDYVDALGLNPGDPFSTPGAAAVDALNYLRGPTAANSTEYAGLIYKAGNSYYATTPVQGDYDSSTPVNPQAEQQVTNAAGMPVGDYHTHPYIHLVNGKPTPGTEQNTSFLTNCFSDTDIDFSNKAGKIFHPFTAYLGTPKGILTYTPSTGAFGHLNY